MKSERRKALQLAEAFPGVFERDELNELLGELALGRELEPLLQLHEGELLHCAGLEIAETDASAEIRLASIVFVQAGQMVRAGPLTLCVSPGERRVFVDWTPGEECLGSVRQRSAETSLSASSSSNAAYRYEIARLQWRDERPRIDSTWWPETARVGVDARSLAAARRLAALLPAGTLERRWLATGLERMRWAEILPILLRHADGMPAVTVHADARAGEQETGVPSLVACLCGLLDAKSVMPAAIESRQRRTVLQPDHAAAHGGQTIYTFAGDPSRPAGLALAIRARTNGKVAHAMLRSKDGKFERPVVDEAVAVVGTLPAAAEFELELRDATLLGAAAYGR